MSRSFIILLFSLLAAACKDSSDGPVNPPATIEPKFSSIQSQVFNMSCTASSCHGDAASGGLKLTSDVAYAQLVNVRSNNDGAHVPGFFRVLPGKPDSSFLYIKLTSPNSLQGDKMPQSGGSLSQEKLDAVRQWILNGANND